jgi:hypothetical protein
MEKSELKRCEVLDLKPSDVIIYKSNENRKNISNFENDELIRRLKSVFIKNKVVILFNGDTIKAIRNAKTNGN